MANMVAERAGTGVGDGRNVPVPNFPRAAVDAGGAHRGGPTPVGNPPSFGEGGGGDRGQVFVILGIISSQGGY